MSHENQPGGTEPSQDKQSAAVRLQPETPVSREPGTLPLRIALMKNPNSNFARQTNFFIIVQNPQDPTIYLVYNTDIDTPRERYMNPENLDKQAQSAVQKGSSVSLRNEIAQRPTDHEKQTDEPEVLLSVDDNGMMTFTNKVANEENFQVWLQDDWQGID